MCEFCTKHGEGKKWYEIMENYSRELLNDPGRRTYIEQFVPRVRKSSKDNLSRLEWVKKKMPLAHRFIRKIANVSAKKFHFGQVVPLEDAEKILEDAKREAETIKKEAQLSAKEVVYQLKSEAEKEIKEKRGGKHFFMSFEVGQILEGTVSGITKFGAFISLPGGKTGMVHISEIDDSYVTDIHKYLKQNDRVKVKVLAVDERGKISLSIRRAQEPSMSFEERLAKFLKDSEERLQDIKKNRESKRGGGYWRGRG